jgi:hypothetical protein
MRTHHRATYVLRIGIAVAVVAAALPCFPVHAATLPQVLYLDVVSGPTSGGENNNGAYLSIFGTGFGTEADLGTNTKVFINNVEVASYRYMGASKRRADIQQISVQVGALGNPIPGVALPVKVTVAGVASNTNQTFTVNPGRILFVDNVNGNDATAVVNDITHAWRYVQTPSNGGAYGEAKPGDFIVMRGTGTNWTDLGNNNSFLRFSSKGGSRPTGVAGSGPITVMAYPTESVQIVNTANYGISGVNRSSGLPYSNYATWITIAGLSIEGDGSAGPIALQVYADYWRIVDNELTAPTATTAKAGGVNGNGGYVSIFGNSIHDIAGNQQENHGVYIDGGSDIADGSVEIAYNHIYNITGGNCIQQYNNGTNGNFYPTNNLLIHHNVVHDTTKHGLNIADGSGSGFQIYDNIVYNTQYAGIRFNTTDLTGARIYNNTFYNTDTATSPNYGAITNDWTLAAGAVDFRNNILSPHPGTAYTGGSVDVAAGVGTFANNLWYGGTDAVPLFDASSKTGNPQFVSAGTDFHLHAGSPAIDAGSNIVAGIVSNDFGFIARPQGSGFDIGAYEFPSSPPAPQITSALSCSRNPVPVGQSVEFSIGVSSTLALTYAWNFGDGTLASAAGSSVHAYSSAGTYTVSVTVTDTQYQSVTATLTVSVFTDQNGSGSGNGGSGNGSGGGVGSGTDSNAIPLTVSQLQGVVRFDAVSKDRFRIAGVIPNLPVQFKPTGLAVTLSLNGAQTAWILDGKGHGKSLSSTFQLKLKLKRNNATRQTEFPGGDGQFTANCKNGAWSTLWSAYGLERAATATPVVFTVELKLAGNTYAAAVNATYAANVKQGVFKK